MAKLEEKGIITVVEISTDWISNLAVVRKLSVKSRICKVDPKPLNRTLRKKPLPNALN